MAKHLVQLDRDADRVYSHSGFSSTILNSFSAPGGTYPWGIAFDGTNIVIGNPNDDKIFKMSLESATIADSISRTGCYGVGWDAANSRLLSSVNAASQPASLCYIHSGFSTTITSSFALAAAYINGIFYDGSNLYSTHNFSDEIFKYSGLSGTVSSSITSPGAEVAGVCLTAANNAVSSDNSADKIFIHSGFSTTITSSFASASTYPTGVTSAGADDAPALTSVDPTAHKATGTHTVTVTGTTLSTMDTFTLKKTGQSDVVGTSVSANATTVSATFDFAGLATGAWDCYVSGSAGNATLSASLTVQALEPPVITSISPDTDAIGTNVYIDIVGTKLDTVTGAKLKKTAQSDVTGDIKSQSSTGLGILFSTAVAVVGTWTLELTNPDGTDTADFVFTEGGGSNLTTLIIPTPAIPDAIDLANTASVRIGIVLTNALGALPATSEITPGTIKIERKAYGGTSWTAIRTDVAMSEAAGLVYYDEVFSTANGYVHGDSLKITFKSVKVTVDATDYEICDATGVTFHTHIEEDVSSIIGVAIEEEVTFDAGTVDTGTSASGSITDTRTRNGTYWQIDGAASGNEIQVTVTINATNPDHVPKSFEFIGRYQGNAAHKVTAWAYNYYTASYEQLTGPAGDIPSSSVDGIFVFAMTGRQHDLSTGEVKIRLIHVGTNPSASHKLYIDKLDVHKYIVGPGLTLAEIDNMITPKFTEIKGSTWDSGTDTLEKIRDEETALAGATFDTATDSLEAISNKVGLESTLTDIKGAGFSTSTDTLEKIRDEITAVEGASFNTATDSLKILSDNIDTIDGNMDSAITKIDLLDTSLDTLLVRIPVTGASDADMSILLSRIPVAAATDSDMSILLTRVSAAVATATALATVDTVVDSIKQIVECDVYLDTTANPWEVQAREKGTTNIIHIKQLFDPDGNNLVDETTRIGRQIHTT